MIQVRVRLYYTRVLRSIVRKLGFLILYGHPMGKIVCQRSHNSFYSRLQIFSVERNVNFENSFVIFVIEIYFENTSAEFGNATDSLQ